MRERHGGYALRKVPEIALRKEPDTATTTTCFATHTLNVVVHMPLPPECERHRRAPTCLRASAAARRVREAKSSHVLVHHLRVLIGNEVDKGDVVLVIVGIVVDELVVVVRLIIAVRHLVVRLIIAVLAVIAVLVI